MALHRMNSVAIGVPNVDETRAFYRDFNLTETQPGVFASADGGEKTSTRSGLARRRCSARIHRGTFGASAAITSAQTSSGTFAIRRATSPSTAATST
jgi:catechol 2,3-dioxygenase-like lactoylglutathione lyase family enzyme